MSELTVRLEVLDGVWETCGVDRMPSVNPESLQLVSDLYGSASCSFQLHRPVDNIYPDLFAYTPCEVEINGTVVWDGRVKETPTTEAGDQAITLNGEGRQFELDDDMYELPYVESDLTRWVDQRTLLTAQVGQWPAGATVQTGGSTYGRGSISLAWPGASGAAPNGNVGAATLDLGPSGAAREVVLKFYPPGDGNGFLDVRGHDVEDALNANAEVAGSFTMSTGTGGVLQTQAFNFSSPHRYVTIRYYRNAAFTFAGDVTLQIVSALVLYDQAREAGGVSVLRASDVVADALTHCPKLQPAQVASAAWQDEALGTPGVAALYRLQETQGTTLHDLVQQSNGMSPNDMTLSGSYTLGRPTLLAADPAGGAVLFSGGSAQTSAPVTTATTTWTLEAVFTPSVASQLGTILFNGSTANGYGLTQSNGSTAAGTHLTVWIPGVGIQFFDTGVVLSVGTPYHVIASLAADGLVRVWVNGTLQYTASLGALPATPTARTTIATGGGFAWQGTIDEVLISTAGFSNHAGSSALATAHWQAALAPLSGTVKRTGFNIPQFNIDGPQTPRAVIDAVNTYHRWRARVMPGGVARFEPQPAAPLFEVGSFGSAPFTDASANSGQEIYNKVIVEASDPAGTPLRITIPGPPPLAANIANPSAAVDVSNWTQVTGTLSRDTVRYDSAPASFGATTNTSGNMEAQSSAFPFPLLPGRKYQVTLRVYVVSASFNLGSSGIISVKARATGQTLASFTVATVVLGWSGGPPTREVFPVTPDSWQTVTIAWTQPPGALVNDAYLDVNIAGATSSVQALNFDTIALYGLVDNTLLGRRGLTRCKTLSISSASTVAACNQIGAMFLAVNGRTPLKGTLQIQGQGSFRKVQGGEQPHPSELLLNTTELIRLSHRVDPDTGGIGRDAVIAQVTYSHADESASVELDNSRTSFDALLARMAIVQQAAGVR